MDWKRKLSSRKFWALVTGVAVSVLALSGAGDDTTVKVVALIGAVGSAITYIFAEAHVDAKKGEKE